MTRLVFLNRNPDSWLGGDAIYIKETIKCLKNYGYQADYISDPNANLDRYDFVHLVHCTFDWAYDLYKNVRKYGKKIVLSPIYYPYHQNKEMTMEIVSGVNVVVCSTNRERDMLFDLCGKKQEMVVISRGVSPVFERYDKCEDYILNVGRCAEKNQLQVIEACKRLGVSYVGVGPSRRGDLEESVRAMKYGTLKIESVPHEILVQYYGKAKVVVVASSWEEFGFPLLEGGLSGCNLVATDKVGGIEWFPDITTYPCGNIESLSEAITKEYKAERNYKNYRTLVKNNFLWSNVTEKLVEVYRKLV